jgi:adenosine deaminase
VLADFEADHVIYLELRTTPREVPTYSISKRRYVETVLSAIDDYETDPKHDMHTKLILSVDRRNTLAQAKETIDLALELQSRGVVGVDLCGDPSSGPIAHLAPAFYEAKLAGLKITLHFAEAPQSSTETELRTLLSWQPDRLGHVIHVKEEFKQTILSKNIGLELCISCNVHAKMITGTFSDHHFGEWREVHKRIALSVSINWTCKTCRYHSTRLVFMATCNIMCPFIVLDFTLKASTDLFHASCTDRCIADGRRWGLL